MNKVGEGEKILASHCSVHLVTKLLLPTVQELFCGGVCRSPGGGGAQGPPHPYLSLAPGGSPSLTSAQRSAAGEGGGKGAPPHNTAIIHSRQYHILADVLTGRASAACVPCCAALIRLLAAATVCEAVGPRDR